MRVLAVDDDISILRALERRLLRMEHTVRTVDSGEAALAVVGEFGPDVILLDVEMRGISGLETLTRLRHEAPSVPVVIMTGRDDVETAVHAFKRGAVDFVRKPFVEGTLEAALHAIAEARGAPVASQPGSMVGESPRFKEAFELAKRFARPDISVLLEGETGTGKELFARTIHDHSKRKSGPFVAVDCSALAEGIIESALFGHERARSPARPPRGWASSSAPTAAPSSSTSSGTSRSASRPSCCACSRSAPSSGWAARGPRPSTCACSRPPTSTCARPRSAASSARISTTASPTTSSTRPRCASAAAT